MNLAPGALFLASRGVLASRGGAANAAEHGVNFFVAVAADSPRRRVRLFSLQKTRFAFMNPPEQVYL